MIVQRQTLKSEAIFEGPGLHSGVPVTVRVMPGESGIRFRYGAQVVEASPENVTDTRRCTKLGEISTIEHLMSALAALEITDAEIEVTAPELPAMGGNSIGYFQGLRSVGFERIGEKELPALFKRAYYHEKDTKIAISAGEGHWRCEFLTGERWPGTQVYEATHIVDSYEAEVASARTFAFSEEVEPLLAAGLAKGLGLESALILDENGYQNEPLMEDEPVRHKMLDLIGDLYLAGMPIRSLNVVGERTGHQANVAAAAQLCAVLGR